MQTTHKHPPSITASIHGGTISLPFTLIQSYWPFIPWQIRTLIMVKYSTHINNHLQHWHNLTSTVVIIIGNNQTLYFYSLLALVLPDTSCKIRGIQMIMTGSILIIAADKTILQHPQWNGKYWHADKTILQHPQWNGKCWHHHAKCYQLIYCGYYFARRTFPDSEVMEPIIYLIFICLQHDNGKQGFSFGLY